MISEVKQAHHREGQAHLLLARHAVHDDVPEPRPGHLLGDGGDEGVPVPEAEPSNLLDVQHRLPVDLLDATLKQKRVELYQFDVFYKNLNNY